MLPRKPIDLGLFYLSDKWWTKIRPQPILRNTTNDMAIDYDGLITQGLAKQISETIRDAIIEGRLQVEERLPTEQELAAPARRAGNAPGA
jgi:hypothetical protein